MVMDIADSSKEQSAGIEQMTKAVAQIDEVTQQNATLVEQAAAAAESLEQQANDLVSAVSRFRIGTRYAAEKPQVTRQVALQQRPRTATLRLGKYGNLA